MYQCINRILNFKNKRFIRFIFLEKVKNESVPVFIRQLFLLGE